MGGGAASQYGHSCLAVLLSVIAAASPQVGAKALFNSSSIWNVGVHYWFEDSRGQKYAAPADAAIGSRVTLHVRSSVSAFLTVWMSDAAHQSLELTSRTDAGPEGKWTGQRVAAGEVFVASGFVVAESGKGPQRLAIFLARAQMEQVVSFSTALEKLARVVARKGADGASVIVREVDRVTLERPGTYIVNRSGGQTGGEIVFQGR